MTMDLAMKLLPNSPYGKSTTVSVLAHIALVAAFILMPSAPPVKQPPIVTTVEIVPVPPQLKMEVPKPPAPEQPAPVPEQVTNPQPQSAVNAAPQPAALPGETSANSVGLASGTGAEIPHASGLPPSNPNGNKSGGGGGRAAASCTYRSKPSYPPAAKSANWEGTVVVRIRVNTDGSVTVLSVREGGRPDVCDAAAAAVANWHYSPARDENGVPTTQVTDVHVKFDLRDS